MRIDNNIICVETKELSDLLRFGIVEGPITSQRITRKDIPFITSGNVRIYKEAIKTAKREQCELIYNTSGTTWISGVATAEYRFYKFKFD